MRTFRDFLSSPLGVLWGLMGTSPFRRVLSSPHPQSATRGKEQGHGKAQADQSRLPAREETLGEMAPHGSFSVTFEPREDGGLRVSSVDVRGLFLSGADPQLVCEMIWPAVRRLVKAEG